MSHPRMAFTAELWSDQAVVCRAMEGQVGCSVVQEFGPFPSWTEANHFAGKLNEGLGLSPVDARKIHTEALLAASECLKITSRKISFWDCAPVIARANLL